MGGSSVLPIHVLSRDDQSISGSWDTLTGGTSLHVPIHVLSRDGQSISGSQDTLTEGGEGGNSVHARIHVLSQDGQSISRYSDKEGWCDLAQCMYILRQARRHWTCVHYMASLVSANTPSEKHALLISSKLISYKGLVSTIQTQVYLQTKAQARPYIF